jgi:hypothetical protein
MLYCFAVEMACKYGVEEAIILQNLAYWILKNQANERHFHNGETWTYNSVKAFQRLFPFWTEKQIRRILTSLEQQGAIRTAQFGGYNRETWYAVIDKAAFQNGQIHSPKRANGTDQTGKSLTDKKTKKEKPKADAEEEAFWRRHI